MKRFDIFFLNICKIGVGFCGNMDDHLGTIYIIVKHWMTEKAKKQEDQIMCGMNQNRRDYLLNLIESVLNQAEIKSCHYNWVNIWRKNNDPFCFIR